MLKTLLMLFMFLLSACNFPGQGQPVPGLTVSPDTAPPLELKAPPQDYESIECAFAWANNPLPELSDDFVEALKDVQPQAKGYTEAYGENCITDEGEVVRFIAMETDFYVTLEVKYLGDKQALGELIELVLGVVAEFPVEDTPGPQPGYLSYTFEAPGDKMRLRFTVIEAESALENGLRGKELFDTLLAK